MSTADIASLVRQLGSSRQLTQLWAAQALRDVLQSDSNRHEIDTTLVAAGAIPVVLRALGSPTPVVQEVAAGILSHLAAFGAADVNSATIVAVGGVPRLVQLASDAQHVASTAATSALACLAECGGTELAAALIAAGGVPVLVARMSPAATGPASGQKANAAFFAAGAVFSLTCTMCRVRDTACSFADSLGVALLDAGAVTAAVRCLRGSRCEQVVVESAGILQNLMVCHESVAHEVGASSALPSLVELLQASSERLQEAAADALGALAISEGLARDVVAAGGITALVRLLQHGGSDAVLKAALEALLFLARGVDSCASIVAAGAAPLVVSLLHTSRSESVLLDAAAVVRELGCMGRDPVRQALQAAGAPAALERVLRASQPADLCDMAVQALRSATDPAFSDAVMQRPPDTERKPANPPAAPASASQPEEVSASRRRPPAPRICAAPGCGATHGLRRCGGCGTVRYCSEACSRKHWREHRVECRRLQAEQAAATGAAAHSGHP